ncbi:MAG: hypothetical protein AAFQ94_21785 [Bacteroidota bacterium]
MKQTSAIPFNDDIEKLYRFLQLTTIPEKNFHIETHQNLQSVLPTECPPFRNNFYEISLVTGGSSISFQINQQEFRTPQQYIVLTSPQQVRSWKGIQRDLEGFVLFFDLTILEDVRTDN